MSIEVTYQDHVYKFGFTRAAAQAAERDGFVAAEMGDKPALMIPTLVYHAAAAYNSGIKRKLVEDIYKDVQDKDGFLTALVEEYVETVNTLLQNNEQGNATWKRV